MNYKDMLQEMAGAMVDDKPRFPTLKIRCPRCLGGGVACPSGDPEIWVTCPECQGEKEVLQDNERTTLEAIRTVGTPFLLEVYPDHYFAKWYGPLHPSEGDTPNEALVKALYKAWKEEQDGQ